MHARARTHALTLHACAHARRHTYGTAARVRASLRILSRGSDLYSTAAVLHATPWRFVPTDTDIPTAAQHPRPIPRLLGTGHVRDAHLARLRQSSPWPARIYAHTWRHIPLGHGNVVQIQQSSCHGRQDRLVGRRRPSEQRLELFHLRNTDAGGRRPAREREGVRRASTAVTIPGPGSSTVIGTTLCACRPPCTGASLSLSSAWISGRMPADAASSLLAPAAWSAPSGPCAGTRGQPRGAQQG